MKTAAGGGFETFIEEPKTPLFDDSDHIHPFEGDVSNLAGHLHGHLVTGAKKVDHIASPELDHQVADPVLVTISDAGRTQLRRHAPFQPEGRDVDIGRAISIRELDIHHNPSRRRGRHAGGDVLEFLELISPSDTLKKMPRLPRISIEGVLQHVMIRGIERRDIFLDDRDRTTFLDRLSQLLVKTKTDCFAWSLLSNHAHFLLRPMNGKGTLSELMLRLLTGYAVVFNLRHHRCGHLFQNRYKSIVCDEDSYLLELVRYIHLNPLRAGLVSSIRRLDSYRWSGHAGIMGHALLPGQLVDDVLLMFDDDPQRARKKYRDFVVDGIAMGRRDELVGGGLKRRLTLSGPDGFEAYDERILGSGEFVEEVWHATETSLTEARTAPPLRQIIERVAAFYCIPASSVLQGSKQKQISTARAVICFMAVKVFGYPGVELTKHIKLSQSGVVLAARRGEALYTMTPPLHELFDSCASSSSNGRW